MQVVKRLIVTARYWLIYHSIFCLWTYVGHVPSDQLNTIKISGHFCRYSHFENKRNIFEVAFLLEKSVYQ